MKKPKYPEAFIGDPWDMLAEEATEIVHARFKAIRWGLQGGHGYVKRDGNPSPREQIIQELGDLMFIVDVLTIRGEITRDELPAAKDKKWQRLCELFGASHVDDWAKKRGRYA